MRIGRTAANAPAARNLVSMNVLPVDPKVRGCSGVALPACRSAGGGAGASGGLLEHEQTGSKARCSAGGCDAGAVAGQAGRPRVVRCVYEAAVVNIHVR